jgi:endoglucanase
MSRHRGARVQHASLLRIGAAPQGGAADDQQHQQSAQGNYPPTASDAVNPDGSGYLYTILEEKPWGTVMASSRSTRVIAITVTSVVLLAAAAVWVVMVVVPGIGQTNPFVGKTLYTYPDSMAEQALSTAPAADIAGFTRIAKTPAAVWLLPEAHSTASVGNFVAGVATQANDAFQLPVFVVYGIPDRDCDNQSAGGLTTADYPAWVSAIGSGLAGHSSIVILEPDSLALAQQCGNVDERESEIRSAITELSRPSLMISGPVLSIYLDGGHSNWIPAATMASLLNSAGISSVRGFASNVSNFNPTDAEVAYDNEVSQLTGGAHYVIDTGRNGNGSNGESCNPSGRALGSAPVAVNDGTPHDANLWIKNPGESDGNCNGGPAAGQWWAAGARALLDN